MAAALQWRPPFYKRSVGEFYCFFMLPSLSPFHCFLCPSHSYCTFVKKPFFFFFLEPSGLCQLLFWRCSYTTWPASVGGMETWLTPNCHKTNSDAISNSLHSSISDPSSGNLCEKSAQTQIVLQVSWDGCCLEPVGKWTKDQRFEFQLQLSTCLSVLEH